MAFPIPKRKHNYCYDPKVLHAVRTERMDENGHIGMDVEFVDVAHPDNIKNPDISIMSIENLVNAGQSLQRVNTAVLDDVSHIDQSDFIPTYDDPPADED